jgi:type IV pilus biogenesis protein CpaD/CtpE
MRFPRRSAIFAAFVPLLACAAASRAVAASSPTPTVKPKKVIVLVEAKGSAPELERFVPRFLSNASDRGLGAIIDARLSGAHLADVGATGEAGTEFRKAWPADVYLGILLAPCGIQRRETRNFDRQSNGMGAPVRVEQVVVSYEANCPVAVSVVGAPGAAVKMIDVTGRNGSSEVSAADTEAEAQAAEDAAERAVKKLVSAVR